MLDRNRTYVILNFKNCSTIKLLTFSPKEGTAVNNMIKLVDYYLQFKDRPEKFKRSYKFEQEIKNSHNPNVAECEIAQLGSIMLKKPKYSSP